MEENLFERRIRDGFLLDCYGAQLTDRQRRACEMTLLEDFSLAEAADALAVSRQDVHDLVSRSRKRMEEFEKNFRMVEKRRKLDELKEIFEENKARLPQDFYNRCSKVFEEF